MIDVSPSMANWVPWYTPQKQDTFTVPDGEDPPSPVSGSADAPQAAAESAAPAADAGADTQSQSDQAEPSLMDRILEVGFRAYAEQIRQDKLQELREKILESMGLTEEELQKLPPEERASVEKLVANEIARRMAAQAELNGGDKASSSVQMAYVHSQTTTVTSTTVQMTGARSGSGAGLLLDAGKDGAGLGPLLALQEQEQAREQTQSAHARTFGEPGKNGRADA